MHVLARGRWDQRLRLASGLVLFAFVLTHFSNHALGLIDLAAMDWMQTWRQKVTRSLPGTIVLGCAIFIHIAFALIKLARRTTLRMPLWEAVQIATGILIPFLLIPHVMNTRIAATFFGLNDYYLYALLQIWPGSAITFGILMTLVWVHACVGLHYWLRLSKIYNRLLPFLYPVAAALPLLAYAGFTVAGRAAKVEASAPGALAKIKRSLKVPDGSAYAVLDLWTLQMRLGFAVLLALILAGFLVRYFRRVSRARVDLTYIHGPSIRTATGPTLLEISRQHNIPHTSICGGRARCSTCRVRVEIGHEQLHPATGAELQTLKSIKADPDIRLACQIRPKSPLTIFRLLATNKSGAGRAGQTIAAAEEAGVERELVIMFMDVRGFTRWSEGKLPYDVVFILNEFFNAASKIVLEEGGWIDKYMGDGMMAVFGRTTTPQEAARSALKASARIDIAVDNLGGKLTSEIGEPVKIGIGLHAGNVVLGHIGYKHAGSLTVIGEAVNTASRLEGLTSSLKLQLIASDQVMDLAGIEIEADTRTDTEVRGLRKPIGIYGFEQARSLSGVV